MKGSRAARSLLALATLGLVLGLAEVVLRSLDLPAFDACTGIVDYAPPDPVLGFAPEAHSEVGGFVLNERGLRGPLLDSPKPAGQRRILYVGDSTCWGLGVPLEQSFAGRVTRALDEARDEGSVELVMGAFPGYSSYHSKILLDRLLAMEPDLVILYVGARNDLSRARYFEDADIPQRQARLDAPWHRIRLLRLAEAAMDRSYRSLFRKLRSEAARARVPPESFRSNLDAMAVLLEEAGVGALVVVPPTSPEFAREHPVTPMYREILETWATAHGLATVELQPRFLEEAAGNLYLDDGYHFTELGHRIAAEEIRAAVVGEGLLPND